MQGPKPLVKSHGLDIELVGIRFNRRLENISTELKREGPEKNFFYHSRSLPFSVGT